MFIVMPIKGYALTCGGLRETSVRPWLLGYCRHEIRGYS